MRFSTDSMMPSTLSPYSSRKASGSDTIQMVLYPADRSLTIMVEPAVCRSGSEGVPSRVTV